MTDDVASQSVARDPGLDLELRNGVTVMTVRLQMMRRRANCDVDVPSWVLDDLERLEAATARLVRLARPVDLTD